ncbi:predicted protein [Coccidioides posadasii str. Silveira]|uniref:Predicted protein n=1 Tax=Coccidioides posadasii (strain RMSCC 757 / Silveira) TaxID=443226 RepID=E9D497_COCPS|nr:predicted protein [Coccidioides posadasii str. Silveira]
MANAAGKAEPQSLLAFKASSRTLLETREQGFESKEARFGWPSCACSPLLRERSAVKYMQLRRSLPQLLDHGLMEWKRRRCTYRLKAGSYFGSAQWGLNRSDTWCSIWSRSPSWRGINMGQLCG